MSRIDPRIIDARVARQQSDRNRLMGQVRTRESAAVGVGLIVWLLRLGAVIGGLWALYSAVV